MRKPADFPLIVREYFINIFCTPEKTLWEKESLAIVCIFLPLSLNCSLIFHYFSTIRGATGPQN